MWYLVRTRMTRQMVHSNTLPGGRFKNIGSKTASCECHLLLWDGATATLAASYWLLINLEESISQQTTGESLLCSAGLVLGHLEKTAGMGTTRAS